MILPTLINLDDCAKAKRSIYNLARTSDKVRINAYNPLLMLLWKANMDMQCMGESTSTVCSYITGYITKAERSHMQEAWEAIASDKDLYSSLFSLGVKFLRSRECGLYEASDILLKDHLLSKSVDVHWVNVNQPSKRKCHYSALQDMAKSNPNSTYIFEPNIIDDHYPNIPENLESVCLHEYVAAYERKKCSGVMSTVPRNKRVLVDYIVYNPSKEDQKDAYYYSLLLLFVAFRKESKLVPKGETSETAFNAHVVSNLAMQKCHNKLSKALEWAMNDAQKAMCEHLA